MYQLIYNHISQSNQIIKQRTTITTTTKKVIIIIECSNKWARPIDVCEYVCICVNVGCKTNQFYSQLS